MVINKRDLSFVLKPKFQGLACCRARALYGGSVVHTAHGVVGLLYSRHIGTACATSLSFSEEESDSVNILLKR